MSKIVCDVCGSTYSETEVQCPICGTAKSEAAKPAVEATGDAAANGGKFSRNNNRKTGAGATARKSGRNNEEGAPSNMAMIIIVAVLLLAIVAVCIFIAVRIFDKPNNPDPSSTPGTSSTEPTTLTIPCTGIELVGNADNTLSFSALTETAQLTLKALPENTTDTVVYTYTSSNPSVVLVDQTGLVTPVGSGSATITVAYGDFSITVNVTCDIPAPITELVLKHSDVTINPGAGHPITLSLYSGELDPSRITWTSSDDSVAIVENGTVTAMSNGKTTITATYGDLTATCIIRVSGMEDRPFHLTTGYQTGPGFTVYLHMGSDETFQLKLIDKNTGEVVQDVVWELSPEGPNYCTITEEADGIRVTALTDTSTAGGGYVYVKAKYQGEEYKCTIVIMAAPTEE